MSPDQRLSPVSPEEGRILPKILDLTAIGVGGGICLYNPPDKLLLDFDYFQLEATKAGAIMGLSPKKPVLGIVDGWEVSIKPGADPQKEGRGVYVRHHPMVSKEEEKLRFRGLWLFRNEKVDKISPKESDSTVYQEEVAFIPVPSLGKEGGGVLMVPVKDLSKLQVRTQVEGFLKPRWQK